MRVAPMESKTLMRSLSLFVGDPASLEQELDDGEDEDHRKQDQGDGRGIAHVEGLESLLVDVEDEGGRRGSRTPVRHYQGLVEDLERGDHGDNHDEEGGRREQ